MTGQADLDVVERVLRETRVDQRVGVAGWSDYVQMVLMRLVDRLVGALPDLDGLSSVATLLGPATLVIAAILVLAIVVTLARIVVAAERRRRRFRLPIPPRAAASAVEEPRDAAAWRGEIERCLARGDLAGALEALWWWFARTIASSPVDRSWTSRELLLHCGRLELAPLAARLDTLLYGARRPGEEDVRRFLASGEEALP